MSQEYLKKLNEDIDSIEDRLRYMVRDAIIKQHIETDLNYHISDYVANRKVVHTYKQNQKKMHEVLLALKTIQRIQHPHKYSFVPPFRFTNLNKGIIFSEIRSRLNDMFKDEVCSGEELIAVLLQEASYLFTVPLKERIKAKFSVKHRINIEVQYLDYILNTVLERASTDMFVEYFKHLAREAQQKIEDILGDVCVMPGDVSGKDIYVGDFIGWGHLLKYLDLVPDHAKDSEMGIVISANRTSISMGLPTKKDLLYRRDLMLKDRGEIEKQIS